jgi:hypothetical protein
MSVLAMSACRCDGNFRTAGSDPQEVPSAHGKGALVTATFWLVGPRIMADKMYHDMIKEQARRNVTPAPQPAAQVGPRTVPPEGPGVPTDGPPFPKDLGGVAGWSMADM